MKKIKKTFNLLIVLTVILLLASCSNSTKKIADPRESSIFQQAEVKNCRVTADATNVKAGAGENFDNLTTLKKGDEVKVLGQVGNWYVIQLDNNRVGCVNSEDTEPIVKEGDLQRDEPITTPEPIQNVQKTPDTPTQPIAEGQVSGLTNEETQMLNLINQERSKNNLPPLKADLELTRVARIKSQDMIDNDYFSHYSPNYGSPFDMMRSFGIEFLQAGENIAANNSVQKAHEGLMASSGHRKNILNPNYTNIGLGIKPSDKYGYIFTQMFINKPQ